MSTVQKILRNSGISLVGEAFFKFVSLFVMIYLARYLGVEAFGKYNFIFAYIAFFSVITDLGLRQIFVREISRDESRTPKLIGNGYFIKLALTFLAFFLSVILINFMSYPADIIDYVYITSVSLFFLSFTDLYLALFEAKLKIEYSIIAKISSRIFSAILIFGIIVFHGTLTQIIYALLFSEMVKTSISYLYSRKIVKPEFNIDLKLCKYITSEALPLAFAGVIWIIYFRINVIMLSAMQGDTNVGLYSAASNIFEPLYLIPNAILVSIFPIMSAAFKNSQEILIKTYRLSFKFILIIVLPIVLIITFFSDKIIISVYGESFVGSIGTLKILIWSLVFTSMNSVAANVLLSINKQKLYMFSSGLCAFINIGLNFILIPNFGYNGAAVATVVTYLVLFFSNFYFASKHLHAVPLYETTKKPIISIIAMAIILYYIKFNIFLLIIFAILVYFVVLLVLKAFTDEDTNIVKNITLYYFKSFLKNK